MARLSSVLRSLLLRGPAGIPASASSPKHRPHRRRPLRRFDPARVPAHGAPRQPQARTDAPLRADRRRTTRPPPRSARLVRMDLFRKKMPEPAEAAGLRKSLSAWDLTFMGIGQMIGAGIFVLTGVAAATEAGPAIILSFVVAGVACAFVAFSYAELASTVGGCGGAYGYAYALFGELPAWVVGWNLVFGMGVALAAVANGWSGYFANAAASMGVVIPDAFTKGPFAGGVMNVPAAAIILVLML